MSAKPETEKLSTADIHYYDGKDPKVVDDEGDPLFGWYFQIVDGEEKPLTPLIGPYANNVECEQGSLEEWKGL